MESSTSTLRNMAAGLADGRLANQSYLRHINRFIIALIVANGIAVILESNAEIRAMYLGWFLLFELFSVSIFSVEYIARLWVSVDQQRYQGMPGWQARIKYTFTPMALVDLLAIAPFYLALLIPIDLRYLRLFRLLRLLKLSTYFNGLQVFGKVLRREAGAIAGAMLIMLILIVVSACLMFSVENAQAPGHFESIAQAIWWSVVTLTTVGYGDVVPLTFGGKLLAIVIMMFGVGTMALPAGILAARFSEELQSRRELLRTSVINALRDGHIDTSEEQAISELKHKLGVPEEVVRNMITMQRTVASLNRFCPHCGESLEK